MKRLGIILIMLIVVVSGLVAYSTVASKDQPTRIPAEYDQMRERVAAMAPSEAVSALPPHIPSGASESRMYASVRPKEGRASLLLLCKVAPVEAARIAAEARDHAERTIRDWHVTGSYDHFIFYNPPWQEVLGGRPDGRDLAGHFDMMLRQNDRRGGGLGTITMGTNAGVLVDESTGTVIWWIDHTHYQAP